MHELSIAMSLLDELADAARREGASQISRVRLRVGRSSGVTRDALLFAWELARVDTPAACAELVIEDVPLAVYCARCDGERLPLANSGLVCGTCGTASASVVRGRELELVSMEIA